MKYTQKLLIKLTAGVLVSIFGIEMVFSAAITGLSDTMSSARVSTVSNHAFVFTTPSGIGAGSTTVITFGTEFGIIPALGFADVDLNIGGPYTASATLAAAPAGTTWGVARTSSTTLTLTNGTAAVAPASTVYLRIGTNSIWGVTGTNQIINATTTGSKSIGISGTMWDTGTTTVNIINNDTVVISAIVPQSLTFSISTNAISFGNLSSISAKYASSTNTAGDTVDLSVAHTLAVSTNAPTGYSITVRGQTLTSQQNSANTINAIGGTPATYAVGTEQFGIYATKAGGVNGTIDPTFATISSFGYDATATTSVTFASGSTPTNTETYSLHYLASIAGLTEAGTYSASLVYVGTANF